MTESDIYHVIEQLTKAGQLVDEMHRLTSNHGHNIQDGLFLEVGRRLETSKAEIAGSISRLISRVTQPR